MNDYIAKPVDERLLYKNQVLSGNRRQKSNEIKTRDIPKNKKYQLRVLEYSNEVKSKINDGNDRCIFYSKTPLIMQ
jgi:hypothetical protein